MSILEECVAALANPNMRAFLRVIRAGESSQGDEAYRMIVGGGFFDSFDDHPRRLVHIKSLGVDSTAAGCYQFLSRTWDGCVKALSLPDFSPPVQDIAAVYLIRGRGALQDVLAGNLDVAIAKCAREWASLPGSPYGQPTRSMAQAKATYEQYGGAYAPAAADPAPSAPVWPFPHPDSQSPNQSATAQPKEDPMATGLLGALAGVAIDLFSPLARKEIARHTGDAAVTDQLTDKIIGALKQSTGQSDPVAALAAAQQDPAAIQAAEASAIETLNLLAPTLDKMHQWDKEAWAASEASMESAATRARAEEYDMTPLLLMGAFVVLGFLILLVGVIVGVQVYKNDSPDTATWSALTGLIGWATGTATGIYIYRFGTTRGSAAKDIVISELARRPKGAP